MSNLTRKIRRSQEAAAPLKEPRPLTALTAEPGPGPYAILEFANLRSFRSWMLKLKFPFGIPDIHDEALIVDNPNTPCYIKDETINDVNEPFETCTSELTLARALSRFNLFEDPSLFMIHGRVWLKILRVRKDAPSEEILHA